MKIQLDSIAFCREIRAALKDDKTAVKWLKSFYETLLFEGTIEDGLKSVKDMFIEADGYKALVAYNKIFNSFKRKMEGATDAEVREAMIARRGAEITQLEERIERRKNLSADATTREGSLNESDGSDAAFLETRTSADTKTLDDLTDKDKRPGAERAAAKPSRTTPPQNTYGEFGNVKMTTADFEKLVQAEGAERANALIEELSSYLASSGKRYKSHYATLLNWGRRKDKENEPKQRYLTTEEISQRNIEESKRQMEAILAHRRPANG
jgi:hypothetical protein